MTQNASHNAPRPRFRPLYALGWATLLFILLDIVIRIVFSQSGLALRNQGVNSAAMDYLFEQMDADDAKVKTAWLGASVMQGYKNVPEDKTVSVLTVADLKRKGLSISGYNLAVAGNNMGDNYLLAHESLKNGANLLVVSLHYKLFSDHGSQKMPVIHKEFVNYLKDSKDSGPIRKKLLKIAPGTWREVHMDRTLAKYWALFRYRSFIFEVLTKTDRPPLEIIEYHYKMDLGFMMDEVIGAAKMTYEDRNTDSLWKQTPQIIAMKNRAAYKEIDLSPKNRRWEIIDLMCKEATKNNAVILFYLTPINRPSINKFKLFNWNHLERFKADVTKLIESKGHLVADLTEAVDPKYFTDFDHLNMNGHKQLSQKIEPDLIRAMTKLSREQQ